MIGLFFLKVRLCGRTVVLARRTPGAIVFSTLLALAIPVSGDDLPRGAVARLGTDRFRLPLELHQACFSPNGKQIVAIAPDGTRGRAAIVVLDAETGHHLTRFRAHEPQPNEIGYYAYSIAFSPDGTMLASTGWTDGIRFWDVPTWKPAAHFAMAFDEAARFVAFSPDGKTLGVLLDERFLDLWDISSKRVERRIATGLSDAQMAAFSPDGRMVAAVSHKTAAVWECSTGRLLFTYEKPRDVSFNAIAFAPDGKSLAVGGPGRRYPVMVIDVSAIERSASSNQKPRPLVGHDDAVRALAYSPDGHVLASASADKTIRFWNAAEGVEIAKLTGHGKAIVCLDFSRDGTLIVSADYDGAVCIWDVSRRAARDATALGGCRIMSAEFSPDGKKIASCDEEGKLRLWDVAASTSTTLAKNELASSRVRFSPDGNLVAVADLAMPLAPGQEPAVRGYDVRTGAVAFSFRCGQSAGGCLAFSAGGRFLVSDGGDRALQLWDIASKKSVWDFEPFPNIHPNLVAISPRGDRFAIGALAADVQIWDLKKRQHLRNLAEHPEQIYALDFTPDGRRVVAAGRNHSTRVWDVDTGRLLFYLGQPKDEFDDRAASIEHGLIRPGGHADWVTCLACSPDGRLLATGSRDTTVRLWSVAVGEHLCTLSGHQGCVNSVAFSPDSRRLVSSSSDTTMLVWDIEATLKETPQRD